MIKNAESCDPKGIHSFGIRLTIELTAELMLQRAASQWAESPAADYKLHMANFNTSLYRDA